MAAYLDALTASDTPYTLTVTYNPQGLEYTGTGDSPAQTTISVTILDCIHASTEVKNAKDATCTVKGYTGDTCCTVCGKVITAGADINALGHNFADTFTTDKKATCTKAGSKSKHCSRCDAKAYVTSIPAKGHTWDAGKVTKKPTAKEAGKKTFICGVCGTTRTEVIPATENSTTKRPEVTITKAEIQKNSVKLNTTNYVEWKKDKLTISWGIISGADGYDIFAARCATKMTSKSLVKTVKGKKSSATLTKIAGKKISGKKSYKVKIKAYKMVNGKKKYIGTSSTYHLAGKDSKTYTNAKKVKVAKGTVSLKKGKTSQIKATIVKQSSKKKLLGKSHGPSIRYISTDTSVATVTSKGKIKAKKKGSCYIYIKALNGINTRVKVRVK